MNFYTVKVLMLTEVRLRLRRISSLVTVLAMVVLAWMVFEDPASGSALLVINGARVLYTSSALALASVTLFGLLFSMAGFYLVRGRIGEDVRCGVSGVIGASQISNAMFLVCRWLGGATYLAVLSLAFMLSIMVCQLFRGSGDIRLLVYLETYALILMPLICFTVSCAILFDSVALLMGKLGDVVYFFVWVYVVSQFAQMGVHMPHGLDGMAAVMMVDFYGLAASMQALNAQINTSNIALGMVNFDPHLMPITLMNDVWSEPLIVMRLLSMALASCFLLPALWIFHRYSIDKIKPSRVSARRSILGVFNEWLKPLSGLVRPAFGMAANMPGIVGQSVADLALTLIAAPSAIFALVIISVVAVFTPFSHLTALLLPAVAIWGLLVSDVSTRDFMVGCEELTGVALGGIGQRYLRHVLVSFLLGMLFVGIITIKMIFDQPMLVLELLLGLFSFSALATLFGRTSRTSRLFLALFLFWLYVATQVPKSPILDALAFNGVANGATMLGQLVIALIALVAGYVYSNRAR